MSKEEIIEVLRKYPRLCSREIARKLNWETKKVSGLLSKMIGREIKIEEPTQEEMNDLLRKFPNLIFRARSKESPNRIKLFELVE